MSNTQAVEATKENREGNGVHFSPGFEENESDIQVLDLLFQLIKRIKLIILFSLLGTVLAAAYTFYVATPQYDATSKLYILSSGGAVLNLSDLQIGSYLASDYIEVFKTWEVHKMVADNLNLSYSYSKMQSMLTVENPSDTRILNITVRSPDPKEAAAMANEYATVAIKYISDTMATDEPNQMSVALVPTMPSTPRKATNILIGFLIGFLLSAGIIILQFILDDRIKSVDDISRYSNLPVLAVIPSMDDGGSKKQKQKRKEGKKP
jgi:capsular polysaccharide biosynthesis protein